MSEQTVVIGAVDFVKSGKADSGKEWTLYKIADGNGTSLGSCFEDVANAARPLIGKRAVIVNELVDNTGKDGKTYKNLKLKSVEPAPEDPEANGNAEVDWDGKDRRICRQACLKVAAEIAPLTTLPPDLVTVTDVLVIAGKLENWVYRGFDTPSPEVPFPVPPGLLNDDDIPF